MDEIYKVFVLTDEAGRIIDVSSDAFLDNPEGWAQIDEGKGDRFLHAQRNYFPLSIMDGLGVYRYKLQNGAPVKRTAEEMDGDYIAPEPDSDLAAQVAELRESNRQLQEALDLLLSGEVE
jgi:hypothetical protein